MNIHHLELFYYVARHGGITEAVRNIPYGIQQPAVSGQVAQLEEHLGVVLFQRRPFAMTPQGETLYRYIEPFFANLDAMAEEIQGGKARQLRIGASTLVLRDHMPELLRNVRKKHPLVRVALREGCQADLEALLEKGEIDLAVTLIERKIAAGIRAIALLELPLALLVPETKPIKKAAELWKQDKIQDLLICLPARESVCKHFQQGLGRLGVDWFPGMEVSSLDLVQTYVGNGYGIGLSVIVPGAQLREGVRAIPLPTKEFSPVELGALWIGKPSAVQQAFLTEFQARAREMR